MKKYELNQNEIKKQFTEQEADALAVAFAEVLNLIHIEHGATLAEKFKAQRTKTAEAVGDLFGLPYISASIDNEAAAIWNTNTSAELIGLEGFSFRGLAVGNGGEFVGIFQQHNEQGEEVGAVRFLILETLGEFIAEEQKKNHEAERVAHLERVNEFRATAREILPKACQVLERYRGKRWGEQTRAKIWEELRNLNAGGVSVSCSWDAYWLDLDMEKNHNNTGLRVSFSWKFDSENKTPAEEITPTAAHLEKLQAINIKTHRREFVALLEEIEQTAEKLAQLMEIYNTSARGKGYACEMLSKYGASLDRLSRRDLDR